MWYKFAIKYNIFGLPIQGDMPIKEFASEDENLNLQDINEDEDEILNVDSQDQEITVDDPTPEDEFTPQDLQKNIEILEQDPTSNFALPPIHQNCRCKIKTLPILSVPGIRDGRRIWEKAEDCCPNCLMTAKAFNQAEFQRLINKGIDINVIPE